MKIDELYNSGVSATKIAKQLNTTTYKILRQLKDLGVNVYNKQNEITWDFAELFELYNEGKTLSDIAKIKKMSVGAVSLAFKKNKVDVINYQNVLRFDNTIFDVIDTEEKAYWLGFIYADGYVSKNRNEFEISLGLKDTYHLQKFANFLKYETNIKTDSYRCRFQVCNKHLKESLIKLGVNPNKSLTLTFPSTKQVPKKLIHHFIRGYFDGDGSIITKETSCVKLRASLLGTSEFLTKVSQEVGIKRNIHNTKSKVKNITFAINNSILFCEYIYKDASIYLERKKTLYDNYKHSK